MTDRGHFTSANAVLVLISLLAATAGFWLAITSQWAGAAGAATVALAGAAGLFAVADRAHTRQAQNQTVPWTATGDAEAQAWLEKHRQETGA